MHGRAATTSDVTDLLKNQFGRPVFDETGLTAHYDFSVQWTPDFTSERNMIIINGAPAANSTSDPSAISIYTALQEQLGLSLKTAKGPVDIVVVDHVAEPTAN